jgi:N-acylneuraminate cytidylyltransferase
MRLAVIPARGGSKRIPRKNIRAFCGKPIIAWSIEAARSSSCFDKIVVSTDDEEIARVAEAFGASVPFRRPASLADDQTGTIPVVRHAVEWAMSGGYEPREVCCIYATAPFLEPYDLRRGLDVLLTQDCSYAFSVTSYAFPIQRALRRTAQGRVRMFEPSHFSTRSQDLEEAWHDAGQFYWGRSSAWLREEMMFSEAAAPVPMPRHRVQDIDTLEDWTRAEWLFRAWQAEGEAR